MAVKNFVCGHCGSTSARKHMTGMGQVTYKGVGDVTWRLLECQACELFTVFGEHPKRNLFFPPEGRGRVSNVDKVPKEIRADYEEAVNCFVASQNKATVVMSRRTVQGVCLNLGAESDSKLFQQIDALGKEGELTNRLVKLAHSIRGLGNDGAHPRDDGIDEVTNEEAERALEFVEHLLQHVYIIDAPEEVAE